MTHNRLTYLPAVVVALVIAIASLMENPNLPPMGMHGDKVLHAPMYVVLAIVLQWGQWHNAHQGGWAAGVNLLITSGYGGLMELGQHYCTQTRTGDYMDWLADGVGAIVGIMCFYLIIWTRNWFIK